MDVKLTVSCTADKDYVAITPIYGDAKIMDGTVKPGLWVQTIAMAKDLECDGYEIKPGQICRQYGPGGIGEGVVVQKTEAVDGGGNPVPYRQEIITIQGVMK